MHKLEAINQQAEYAWSIYRLNWDSEDSAEVFIN